MKEVRVIIASTENGNTEIVYFTQDFETPAADLVPDGLTIDNDSTQPMDLPIGFPLNYILTRE